MYVCQHVYVSKYDGKMMICLREAALPIQVMWLDEKFNNYDKRNKMILL